MPPKNGKRAATSTRSTTIAKKARVTETSTGRRGRSRKEATQVRQYGRGPRTSSETSNMSSRGSSHYTPVIEEISEVTARKRAQQRTSAEIHMQPTTAQATGAAANAPDSADNAENRVSNNVNEWINSTAIRQPFDMGDLRNDPVIHLSRAIENALLSIRENSIGENNSRLVNRLTSAKRLPSFSGDPIEWLHFKEAFELSTELGGYSDRENIARLFEALKGEARNVIGTLLATCRDAQTIMKTLEINFGNKRIIGEKLVGELHKLPNLETGGISLALFATKLRNAVSAFKSLKLLGYLYSPDLIKEIGQKLPVALKYSFNRYSAEAATEKTEMEKLADFLTKEAELAAAAGVFDFHSATKNSKQSTIIPERQARVGRSGSTYNITHELNRTENRYNTRSSKTAVVCAARDESERVNGPSKKVMNCVYCSRTNHQLRACIFFKRVPLEKRWELVKKHKLCFGCLKSGHMRNDCRNAVCTLCKKRHHTLLHSIELVNNSKNNQSEKELNSQ